MLKSENALANGLILWRRYATACAQAARPCHANRHFHGERQVATLPSTSTDSLKGALLAWHSAGRRCSPRLACAATGLPASVHARPIARLPRAPHKRFRGGPRSSSHIRHAIGIPSPGVAVSRISGRTADMTYAYAPLLWQAGEGANVPVYKPRQCSFMVYCAGVVSLSPMKVGAINPGLSRLHAAARSRVGVAFDIALRHQSTPSLLSVQCHTNDENNLHSPSPTCKVNNMPMAAASDKMGAVLRQKSAALPWCGVDILSCAGQLGPVGAHIARDKRKKALQRDEQALRPTINVVDFIHKMTVLADGAIALLRVRMQRVMRTRNAACTPINLLTQC